MILFESLLREPCFSFYRFSLAHDGEEETSSNSEFIATLGIFRTPGFGLDVVTISSRGPATCSQVIPGISTDQNQTAPSLQVSKYWLSDVVDGSRWHAQTTGTSSLDVDSFFVWAIELFDGSLLSWLVPFFVGHHAKMTFRVSENPSVDTYCICSCAFSLTHYLVGVLLSFLGRIKRRSFAFKKYRMPDWCENAAVSSLSGTGLWFYRRFAVRNVVFYW